MSGPADARDAAVPVLSVVVAAKAGEGSAAACLEALVGQLDGDVELILVEDAPTQGIESVEHALAHRIVRPDALVPELWSEGVRLASGHLVGLLAATVVPDRDWVALTRKLHEDDAVAAIGGPIDPSPGMRIVDWAVYFCRYAPYMSPIRPDPALDVAGDNATYRHDVLRRYAHLYDASFSEPFVHKAMRSDGHVLRVDPARVVHHIGGADARGFCRHRFRHGQDHGRRRAEGQPRARVILGAAATPLVPLVMTLRAARHVWGKQRHRGRFLAAVPVMVWFYAWWAAGEMLGGLAAVASPPSGR